MQEKLSKEEVGRRIRRLRTESGYSQDFVAKILNVSRSNYSQIEIGNQYPTFDSLSVIASFYSKSYEWLLHGHEAPETSSMPPLDRSVSKQLNPSKIAQRGKVLQVTGGSDYALRLHDQHYLETLQIFDLSAFFLEKDSNYRSFLVEDHSFIESIHPGDLLIGKQLNNYSEIILNETYILITLTGITFCRINHVLTESTLLVCENNKAFTMAFDNIQEIWIAVGKYSTVVQPAKGNLENIVLSIGESIKRLENDVAKLNRKSK